MLRGGTVAGGSERTPEVAGEPAFLGQARVAASSNESVAVLIPLAPRIVVAEDCGIGLGFVVEAECQVAFDKPLQRLGYMRRRLIIVDNAFETVHRCQVLSTLKIVSADFHFLTGQMIASKIELELGITGIFAVGKPAHHIIERLQRLFGNFLVTTNISYLNVV